MPGHKDELIFKEHVLIVNLRQTFSLIQDTDRANANLRE